MWIQQRSFCTIGMPWSSPFNQLIRYFMSLFSVPFQASSNVCHEPLFPWKFSHLFFIPSSFFRQTFPYRSPLANRWLLLNEKKKMLLDTKTDEKVPSNAIYFCPFFTSKFWRRNPFPIQKMRLYFLEKKNITHILLS